MPVSVKPAIPASQTVNVVPSVLAAGGNALDLIGLIVSNNWRVPIGSVYSFADETDVGNFFGADSTQAALGTIYFNGPNNATKTPGALLFAQYPEAAVSAWLRSASLKSLALSDLQGFSGLLSVTIDGVVKSNTINLAAVTSFSNAAETIEDSLAISGAHAAAITGSIGGTFTATTSGSVLTVSAGLTGSLQTGDTVTGSGGGSNLNQTVTSQLTGTLGGVGTYQLSGSATGGNLPSATVIATSTILNATAVSSGTLAVGDKLAGTGVSNVYIASQISGTIGGVGLYGITGTGLTVASEGMNAFLPAVFYDSTLNELVVYSGTTGTGSTVTFGSGALATDLKLTQATGAVLSQGAAATSPLTFMASIISLTQNWAEFTTDYEPVLATKKLFAQWVNSTNNRYVYEAWDTDILNTEAPGIGPGPFAAYVTAENYSGVCMVYEDPAIDTIGGELAAFGMGWTACLDFDRFNGRQTAKFKSQAGLAAQVFDGTTALNLTANGLNYYGDNTTANEAFIYYAEGTISGDFLWKDSYVNQIWLNNQLQLGIMVGLTNSPSVPYNLAGAALIESFCRDAINAAVNFGAIRNGVALSAAQIAEVNQAAGLRIDNILFNQGWYLQVLPATAQVRRARTSPPCTLWYVDGGSVHKITLASIEVQ